MPGYIIYCRKSSESEERQVLSIESQLTEIRALAERLNLPIAEILTESKSAKQPGRPVFNQLMEQVYQKRITGILCWKLDRLARNPLDGSSVVWALDQGHIDAIITPHGTFKNFSNDKFLMQIEFGMAKKYVDDLSDNIRRGNRAKLEKGWYPGKAPLGYLNEPNDRTIVPDPERFDLMRKMWDLLLTGTPILEIWRIANEQWGFKTRAFHDTGKELSRSGLYKIFKNPFYYGLIERKEGVFQGKHTPLVTEGEFRRAQQIMWRKGKPKPHTHQFAFTGLMRCGECGSMITAEEKINRFGSHYTYYRCTKKNRYLKCSQKYIEVRELEKQMLGYLEKAYIPATFLKEGLEYLEREEQKERNQDKHANASLEKAYSMCTTKLANLTQMKLSELLSDEEFMQEKKKLLEEKMSLESQLQGNQDVFSFNATRNDLERAHSAKDEFLVGSLRAKREVIESIGSNPRVTDKTFSIELKKPFLVLQEGLRKINSKNARFGPRKNADNKGRNPIFLSDIRLMWSIVDDIRKYHKDHNEQNRGSP